MNVRAICTVLIGSLLFAACGGGGGISLPAAPTASPIPVPPVASSPIQHVIVLIQENRTFDNMFNGFPTANTVTSGFDHNGSVVPLTPVSLSTQFDPDHAHPSLVTEYNNGLMNGFDLDTCDFNAFNPSGQTCTGFFAPPADFTYGYVPGPGALLSSNNSDTILYWLLAGYFPGEGYGLADEMFSTRQVPSFPGHQFLIAGQGPADDTSCLPNSPTCSSSTGLSTGIWGCDAPAGTIAGQFGATYGAAEIFANPPCYDYQTIADVMNAKNVTWKYYTGVVGSLDGLLSAYDAVKHIRYGPQWTTNISTPMTNILNDIQNNTLPQVAFVTPPGPASDHSGFLQSGGPGWVAEIYLFLAQNPSLYANTAVFVTWDDSGGWYDHVAPPCYDARSLPAPATCDANGPLGFRVPLMVISPYAIRAVNHDVHSYGSILHFIEKNWGLQSLGTDDALSDDLSDMFNYSQTPIKPLINDPRFKLNMTKYSKSYFEHLHGDHQLDSE